MDDHQAIQQVLNRYTEAASRRDLEAVAQTFHPSGIWELTAFDMKVEGRDAIVKTMRDFLEPMDYLVQTNSPAVIEVDGDTARARATIREGAKFSGKDEAMEVLGIYNDELVRTPDGWQFTHRVFNMLAMNSKPLLPQD